MATYQKYECFVEDLLRGTHDWDAHTFRIALTATAPNAATHTIKANITELPTSGGYTVGGNTTTISVTRSAGTAKITGTSPAIWTGSGGGFTFRYAVLYNDTSPSDSLVAYWDYGAPQLVNTLETLTVQLDATNGIFTVT